MFVYLFIYMINANRDKKKIVVASPWLVAQLSILLKSFSIENYPT